MDVPLYAIALVVFAVLYLALSVFLAFVLLIALLIMLLYLVVRYPKLPEGYPYGQRDTSITLIFIGVTWSIFTFLGPKDLPFIGNGLTYASPLAIPIDFVLWVAIAVAVIFLVIFSFVGRSDQSGAGLGAEEKPKQGVGA